MIRTGGTMPTTLDCEVIALDTLPLFGWDLKQGRRELLLSMFTSDFDWINLHTPHTSSSGFSDSSSMQEKRQVSVLK